MDKSDIPVNLSKVSDIVKNDVLEKIVHDKLVAKVNNIDSSEFAFKNKYDIQNRIMK